MIRAAPDVQLIRAVSVDVCREAGVPVLVDGAHAVGSLPDLAIPSLGCQYYTSNLHKWMCTPKVCCFVWALHACPTAALCQ
jgi:selenocysteine lyase/cysteine desulfurase